MSRAQGSNAQLLMKRQDAYGTRAIGDFVKMPFTSETLGSEQGLIPSPVLGFGRDPSAPFQDVINDDGDIGVPVDPRYLGLWLTGLFGDPETTAVKAEGSLTFAVNPAVGNTITMNGVAFSFIAGASGGTDIQIKGTLTLTLDEVVSVLNASVNASVDDATYSKPNGTTLKILHDATGPAGNAYTLAASHATPSAATLQGGGYDHVFESGAANLPAYSVEVGMPEVPAFFMHDSVVMNSIGFNFARSGAAIATVNVIAQGETAYTDSHGGTPDELDRNFISQFKGSVRSGGEFIGNLTAASVSYSNNMEKIETIRDDGRIEGADPSVASATGTFETRFADMVFINKASTGVPIDLSFWYVLNPSLSLKIDLPEVWLPKPKLGIEGPGGIPASFSFQAARDAGDGLMMRVTLRNDLDGTQYQ